MNTGIAKIVTILAVSGVLAGCGTVGAYPDSNPILSAEQAQAMIHIEVRELEALPTEQVLADLQ